MGMSASQVRFLSLQNRKNTIGRELMSLSNRKLALSRDMSNVANNYTQAMNQVKLKWSSDAGITYNDLSYDLMMKPNLLNSETPYIVTDKNGRVVVDQNGFTLKSSDGTQTYDCKSLYEMAKYISSYSATSINGDVSYDYTDRINNTTNSGLGCSDPDSYIISKNFGQFNYDDAFRIDLFHKMGLITDDQVSEYRQILKDLYGDDNIRKAGNYDGLLHKFDQNKSQPIMVDGVGVNYTDVYGSLSDVNGVLNLDGGCAYGNLELAKAYRSEYQAYLNTTFKHDILSNTNYKIASAGTTNTNMLDYHNFTATDNYRYNEKENTGISFRTIDLLAKVSDHDVSVGGGSANYNAEGIMNNLKFYAYDDKHDRYIAYSNFYDVIGEMELKHMDSSGDLTSDPETTYYKYYSSGSGLDADASNIVHWSKLFDHDGKLSAGSGSYDTNNDGYFMGKDYLDLPGAITGISLLWSGDDYDIDGGGDYGGHWLNYNGYRCLRGVIDCLGNSAKTIKNINEDAVDYATEKTYEFYMADSIENGDTTADAEWESKFIFGWAAEDEGTDYISLDMTNVINTFWTFYAMYDSVNRELGDSVSPSVIDDRIFTNKTKKYKDVVYDLVDLPDNTLAMCSAAMSDAQTGLAEYINRYDDNKYSAEHIVGGDLTPGNKTITYAKINNDNSYTSRSITGYWDGTQFTKISSVVDTKDGLTTRKLSASGSVINEERYEINAGGTYDLINKLKYTKSASGTEINVQGNGTNSLTGIDGSIINNARIKAGSDGTTSLGGIINSISGSSYETKGHAYYIMNEDGAVGGNIKDSRYQYCLDKRSVENSVFTSVIYLKPEDKYGTMLDDLVARCQQRVDDLENNLENFFTGYQTRMMEFFDALFKRISKNGWVLDQTLDGTQNADNYLNSMFQNNQYYVTEAKDIDSNNYYKFTMKQATGCTVIYQVHDTDAEEKALAEYNAQKASISAKEKKIDKRMTMLETEQEAINTEMEGVKKVRNENVEKYFKIFA